MQLIEVTKWVDSKTACCCCPSPNNILLTVREYRGTGVRLVDERSWRLKTLLIFVQRYLKCKFKAENNLNFEFFFVA